MPSLQFVVSERMSLLSPLSSNGPSIPLRNQKLPTLKTKLTENLNFKKELSLVQRPLCDLNQYLFLLHVTKVLSIRTYDKNTKKKELWHFQVNFVSKSMSWEVQDWKVQLVLTVLQVVWQSFVFLWNILVRVRYFRLCCSWKIVVKNGTCKPFLANTFIPVSNKGHAWTRC